MDSRVDGTNVGQRWRVTGIRDGDTPGPARVALEFWLEYKGENGRQYQREIKTFDPELARRLGEHLIEMADYVEE